MTRREFKTRLSDGAFFLAAALLALKIPYLRQAWATSPLDRANMASYGALTLIAAVAGALAARKCRPSIRPRGGVFAPLLLVGAFLALGFGLMRSINALQLLAPIAALWLTAWMRFGRRALFFAPCAVLAALAVPGVLYWTENFIAQSRSTPHAAYTPTFTPDSQSGMLGRKIPVSKSAEALFKTSKPRHFIYADDAGCVRVLAVEIGSDIHEIHPASHCMKSAGWRISAEKLREIALSDGETLEVDEVLAASTEGKMLVWIWFSSGEISTGSFLMFRRLYSPDGAWRTYQVSTELGESDDAIGAARERLRNFLSGGRRDA